MVLMMSLPASTVVSSPEAAELLALLVLAELFWEVEALPVLAEPVELVAPLPPQATRDRDMARAIVIARIFFIFMISFSIAARISGDGLSIPQEIYIVNR